MNKKFYFILIFSLLNLSYQSLTDIQVIGGNYGFTFKFIIVGTTNEAISNASNIPIAIEIGGQDFTAECSVENTNTGETAIYSCTYNENINGAIYLKQGQESISGITSNMEIKPKNLNVNYKEAINLEFNKDNENWEYVIKGEIAEGNLYIGSLFYMDIKVNNTNGLSGCILSSKDGNNVEFKCKINKINQDLSNKIIIPKEHTSQSTLKFSPALTDDKIFLIYKDISFIEGKNLKYNAENKWEFLIIIPYQEIPAGTKCIVDILYNGILSQANCLSNDNSMLECTVKEDSQEESDLVKLHYMKSDLSTITWNNLTNVYEIPIEKQLRYISSYDLTYNIGIKKWEYKIKIPEDYLPQNALVTIDIIINNNKLFCECYHKNSELKCQVDTTINEEDIKYIKLSHEKKDGSISWESMNKDIPITISATITYENSYNLIFEENTWKFILKATPINQNKYKNFPISIKINYDEDKKVGIAYCYPDINNNKLYNCEVDYENQNANHLIIINGENNDNEVSVIWSTNIGEKKITLSSSLHYSNAFDLKYFDEKWNFKIKINDDLPNGSKVVVDIVYNEINSDTATCIYDINEQILSCTRDSLTQSPRESLILKKEQKKGSIIWEDLDISEVKMPITITKGLKRAYGLIFDIKWNFYMDVENIGIIPDNSFFLLDILQNDEETTARCELSSQSDTISKLYCYLDKEVQSRNDIIKINIEKKDGSINWSNYITISNNTISEFVSVPISFNLIDAYDMEYVDNNWIFKIVGKSDREIKKGETFKIDIEYILLSGEQEEVSKCWSEGGPRNTDIIFLCNVEKDSQSDEASIQIKYSQSEISSIIWNGGIYSNYKITLKGVNLILKKAYDLTLDKTWKFRIDYENEIGNFPSGSQIIIEVIIGNNKKSLKCSSLNNVNNKVIICDTGTSSKVDLIKIVDRDFSESSAKWIENKQDDYLIFVNVEFEYVNVYNLQFITNKWVFLLKKKGDIPLGSKFIVDIKYNNEPAIAICYNKEVNDELKCYVRKEIQSNMDLVQLYRVKTRESSITWTNL